ncbi:1,2-phenylacetyl-CoA epoxidase subunit PaaD [Alteribacter natronophilus]|uniref:1,2-phenylacetyl-CoA epoxidase subunit PaaD n=1 Tax=Alteribacter natronophilus TaxID=2583810 RepID=UPI00110DB778|nr:1,2-phenylacetyl-CoA epoxidase subunit PaaD [Alteribacter natronophilus]TMW73058.1 phenylacetate-CoA oxygenase subunit PaaJ [Alteribacter natronophilus]
MVIDRIELKQAVQHALQNVKDPEIPSISVMELGMIAEVSIEGKKALIKATPTFVGCPALDIIKRDIENAVKKVEGIDEAEVKYVYNPPWTTDLISSEGREKLKEYGISPPPAEHEPGEPWKIDCPYCGSTYTTMENIFGPTACRSILYCRSCKNPFEAMKPVADLDL